MTTIYRALALAGIAAAGLSDASAASLTLTYDYIATNLHGQAASPVASITITDLSDLGIPPGEPYGGVRVSITNLGSDQFASGAAGTHTWIASFELNFPNTEAGVYDSNANLGRGNHWADVAGVPLGSGGIEWQEGGANNGWAFFGQEINFSGSTYNANSLTQGRSATIDLFNAPGYSNISVAALLANPVLNAANPSQPAALSWIKIRGEGNANAALRGVAGTGYWGNSEVGGTGANTRYQVNVLATVPVPAALPLFFSALAGLGWFGRSRRS